MFFLLHLEALSLLMLPHRVEVAWVLPEGPEESYSVMRGSSFPPLIRRRGNEGALAGMGVG